MEEKDFSWSFKGQWEDDGGDSPGDPVFKNPPCDRGDPGLNPGQGTKIPHAAEQLSLSTRRPCLATREPTCCND